MDKTTRLIMMGLLAVALACGAAAGQEQYEWKSGRWVKAATAAAEGPAGELALIRQHLAEGRQSKAVKAARKYIKRYGDSPSCADAMSLAGQAELDRGRYWQAFEWFQRQLASYPSGRLSQRAIHRQYEIADAFLSGKKRVWGPLRLSAKGEAVSILHRIAEQDPGSDLARKALLRIGGHYYSQGMFAEATEAYDQFGKLYGRSAEAPEAMFQAAMATYLSFRGPAYDETPLVEAEQRFTSLLEMYPAVAAKTQIPQYLADIADKRSQKRYLEARFYERVSRPGAAAYYYRLLIAEYPNSTWATPAREDLARLGEAAGRAETNTDD